MMAHPITVMTYLVVWENAHGERSFYETGSSRDAMAVARQAVIDGKRNVRIELKP